MEFEKDEMITRDQIVKRFLDECKTSANNQEAVNRVEDWLKGAIAYSGSPDEAERIKKEADAAGGVILLLVQGTELLAKKSSSVLSGEKMGTPGIKNG